eukprot:scaffold91988_cov26-Tisochrysis_lutea.AAC.2
MVKSTQVAAPHERARVGQWRFEISSQQERVAEKGRLCPHVAVVDNVDGKCGRSARHTTAQIIVERSATWLAKGALDVPSSLSLSPRWWRASMASRAEDEAACAPAIAPGLPPGRPRAPVELALRADALPPPTPRPSSSSRAAAAAANMDEKVPLPPLLGGGGAAETAVAAAVFDSTGALVVETSSASNASMVLSMAKAASHTRTGPSPGDRMARFVEHASHTSSPSNRQ